MRTLLKKLVLILGLISCFQQFRAQITLESTYPNGRVKLSMVDLEISGMKYLLKNDDAGNRFLKLYNLNHSLWKTIDCNGFPLTVGPLGDIQYNFDALYITETLFDCDPSIEFMYVSASGNDWFTGIYNENGISLLVADSCAPMVKINIPQQVRPIYNTPLGTKLILSHQNGTARVYDLPCMLTTEIGTIPSDVENEYLNIYPNPSFSETTIEYIIPNGFSQAEIVITDLNGKEIKRYQVDNNFSNLILEQNEIQAGTYMYSLQVESQIIESKKIIVLN